MDYEFPSDLKYTKTHEWVRIEDDSATVGIAGEIESVKAVAELKLPLTGEITEINEEIEMKPELVNESPFGEGWLLKIKFTNPNELDVLLSVEDYKKLVDEDQED